jgi:hypothetical protein
MIKKIMLFAFGLSIFGLGAIFAYSPTDTDTRQLNDLKNVLSSVNNADLRNYHTQFVALQRVVTVS